MISRLLTISFLVSFLTIPISAQTFRGRILGTVTDPNSAVVAGAKVTAKNVGTGLERATTTDSDGNYSITELPIGMYEVRVEQTGFQTAIVKNVIVEVAGDRRVDVSLNVTGGESSVTVSIQEQVETTSTTLGGSIQAKAVEDLPINGRDFTKFLTLDAMGACIPGTYHFGSLGRNSLTGPGYKNLDFSVFKNTNITEKVKLQLRADIFNIFNHPNFSSPLLPGFSVDAGFNGVDASGRGIGFLPITVTPDVGIGNPFLGGGGSRNIQLSARLSF